MSENTDARETTQKNSEEFKTQPEIRNARSILNRFKWIIIPGIVTIVSVLWIDILADTMRRHQAAYPSVLRLIDEYELEFKLIIGVGSALITLGLLFIVSRFFSFVASITLGVRKF